MYGFLTNRKFNYGDILKMKRAYTKRLETSLTLYNFSLKGWQPICYRKYHLLLIKTQIV